MSLRSWYLIGMFISTFMHNNLVHPYALTTIYGDFAINESVLIELLQCPTMQRLHNIRQYGIGYYAHKPLEYTRYQHSVGVFVLLRKFGASLHEQIAGLLHDVSHTVFSHVSDYMYHSKDGNSYQDDIHEWFINQTEIPEILQKYGIAVSDVLHKKGTFRCLEQDLPTICADRLEYNLYGGYIENKLTKEDIDYILNHLHYDNDWYFDCSQAARKLADVSLYLTEFHFGSAWNTIMNSWAGKALKRAMELSIITNDDLHFSTDEVVWNKLNACTDSAIQEFLYKLHNMHSIIVYDEHDAIECIKTKFRGINPFVLANGEMIRLTDLDHDYKNNYETVKNKTLAGWFVRY